AMRLSAMRLRAIRFDDSMWDSVELSSGDSATQPPANTRAARMVVRMRPGIGRVSRKLTPCVRNLILEPSRVCAINVSAQSNADERYTLIASVGIVRVASAHRPR